MSKSLRIAAPMLLLAGIAPAAAPDPIPATGTEKVLATLEQVKEIRRLDVVTDDSGGGFGMFDVPGLELRFGLDASAGRKIVEVRQPTALRAADSTGADLSKLPPTGFGTPSHVDVIREWDQPPHALTFKLALPARTATSFALTARMEAVTYQETEEFVIVPEWAWKPITSGPLGDHAVKVRLEVKRGSVHLTFEPGTVRDMIEAVELEGPGLDLEHQGTMWNDAQFASMFTGNLERDARVTARITVRKGLRVLPVEIELRDQPLP